MKKKNVYILDDRAILYLNGEDTKEFLAASGAAADRIDEVTDKYRQHIDMLGETTDQASIRTSVVSSQIEDVRTALKETIEDTTIKIDEVAATLSIKSGEISSSSEKAFARSEEIS